MPTSNHTKQILTGNFKTQSHVLCTAFWFFFMSSIQGNLKCLNVNLTNGFHVAVRLFNSRSQVTTKCGKNQKNMHMWPWRDNLCELRLVRCNFHYVIGISGILPKAYKHASWSLEIFSALTILSHSSIMLPPHQPRVFARLARWQLLLLL